ncbi:predicted protein [Histoplasma capsulatum H143]|uniref:Uncharacterized protein n=1 Tax=Ajellomyces capsulatus (strain H143) TaxID=544712 RepID=C6HP34_AJECH|nr:predicted protein [Histoplasma capsulatum H143]
MLSCVQKVLVPSTSVLVRGKFCLYGTDTSYADDSRGFPLLKLPSAVELVTSSHPTYGAQRNQELCIYVTALQSGDQPIRTAYGGGGRIGVARIGVYRTPYTLGLVALLCIVGT